MNRAIEAQNNLRISGPKELADYVRDLKASHDALLVYARHNYTTIVYGGVLPEQISGLGDIIANAERLT